MAAHPAKSHPLSIRAWLLAAAAWLLASGTLWAAFGLTTATDSYTVDTGAGLVFQVRRTDNGSNTQSAGELMSLVYNGVEYQNLSKGSHINSGFDYIYNGTSAVTVDAETIGTEFIKITVVAGDLTHYYMARDGFPHIYMATYFTTEPETQALCRFIVRVQSAALPNGPPPSDIRGNTGAIESADIFGMADGTTRSKHYSNMRLKDWSHTGGTGPGVGLWMVRSNHEGDSGGPFYRSLLNQHGDDHEITYILNYGQAQTEPYRTGILNGPYTLTFTDGGEPPALDTSWVSTMGLTGFVDAAGRGTVSASGIVERDTAYPHAVGFANANAQYWADAAAGEGSFTKTGMLPGTYTMTVYKEELAVYTDNVTVTAGATTPLGTLTIADDPSRTAPLWRIGNWDGSPREFLNGDIATTMHPSDVRMASWDPGTYVVGTSTPATGMPCYQWKDIAGGYQLIQFELAPDQLVDSTVRVGITIAYEGGRPNIDVNGWSAPLQGPSTQPDSRSLTTGSYRGNNTTYAFNVPASALVAGTNTISLYPISGSSSPQPFLSPGYSLDCIDMFQGAAQFVPLPGAPSDLGFTVEPGSVTLSWTAASGAVDHTVLRSATSGGPYTTIATGVTATSYADTTVGNGNTYFYVVRGSNRSGSGQPSNEALVVVDGPSAHYRFEGNALDDSGNGNHGTATAVTYASAGGNQSAEFNGSTSYVEIPRSIENDFTVALWVKTTETGGSGPFWWMGSGLVDGEVNGSLPDWGLVLLGGKAAFGIGGPDTTFFSTSLINDGAWHHVAATRDNTTGDIGLYIDGVLETTGTGPAGSRTAPPTLRIGSLQMGIAPGFFNGGIDSVRLYNSVVDGTTITALANAGLLVPAAPGGLNAIAAGSSQIDLDWNATPATADYTVKRSTSSGGPYMTIATGIAGTSFSDAGLVAGASYYYVVSGGNANGEGADSSEAGATTVTPPPTVHLRFDESSGTTAADSSGNGWHGTLVGGAAFATGAGGKINNAVQLDGAGDYVAFAPGLVEGLNDFTVTAWVKWDGGTDWQRVFDFGSDTSTYMFLSPRTFFNTTRFAITTGGPGGEQVIEGPALPIGTWTHVAVTVSGTTGTLYLDGASAGTNDGMTLDPSDLGNTPNNFIGKSQFPADATLNGTVDEFQLHARALNAAEVASLASPPPAPGGVLSTASDGQVVVDWNAAAGATAYHLKRSTTSGGSYTTIASSLGDTSYTDTDVTNGTTYYYVVTSVESVAESAHSAEVSATPLSAIQEWRLANFGTIENSGAAADTADPDGDGTLNETEFRLGLDPNDGTSAFRLNGGLATDDIHLTWPFAAGVSFEIQRGLTLDNDWAVIGTVTGAGAFTDPSPPPTRAFYRVGLLP